jgi:hypothetical protein
MTLDDIYTQLAYGELKQLFIGGTTIDTGAGAIPPENYPKLLPSVELGLTELHKRFCIREDRMTVELQPGKASYPLTFKFAESNTASQEPIKYIKDSASPFMDNLFKVERIYGVLNEEEYEIPLNEIGNGEAIRTTTFNTLMVPTDTEEAPWLLETTELIIIFRADHPVIDNAIANATPDQVEVYLPPMFIEALCLYIASRLHNPIGMVPGALHQGNNYFAKFLTSVEELKKDNYEIDNDTENTKLSARGFC